MLKMNNIVMTYDPGGINELCVFNDFSFGVKKGEFVSLVGSNGSGKTTLLNIICGTLAQTSGEVYIAGENMSHKKDYYRARRIGRVLQNPSLGTCPNLTIAENMALAENKGKKFDFTFCINKKRISAYRDMVRELSLGLEDKMDVKMGSLSGGQRQAVSLLIATMIPIDFLILDEHTAALDPLTSETIMHLTDKTIKEKKLTAVMVTHNLRYAVEYGDRLVMMDKGRVVMDISGKQKQATAVEDVLKIFNDISIECGN
ncbi:MAG: ATP-binding cassette domain-containing protein [Eubacteriaceae bacterium]|nr:ATP-binding cassette domain-containing protein [Eubacteriaceae bacterium]